jgi:diacylglycerol kinase family enzyme
MIILLNPHAGGGTALDKWRRISAILPPIREKIELYFLEAQLDLDGVVKAAVSRGDHHFLAAGGDGTVNATLNALMRLPPSLRERVIFGAIGLGSSNDFHKPADADHIIEGIPARMDFQHPAWRDVGSVRIGQSGHSSIHYFLINASAGITAEGNALFNKPDMLLSWLKSHSTPMAILYAALRALTMHENRPCTIEIRGYSPLSLNLTNLGIVKNPHFSGSLHYEVPANYADGDFQIFLAEDMHLIERVGLLQALSRGKFRGLAKTRSLHAPELTIASSRTLLLELDGEIHQADHAEFTILPKTLQVCS